MKKIILIIAAFLTISCENEIVWKTGDYGLISSLENDDTLKIRQYVIQSGTQLVKFYPKNNLLYVEYNEDREYGSDKNFGPFNVSNNVELLEEYKNFEENLKTWENSSNHCSEYKMFWIYTKTDTIFNEDKMCVFPFFIGITQLIEEL